MPYDPTTRKLRIAPDDASGNGFLLDMGFFYLNFLRDLALDPKSSALTKADWRTVEAWLGCSDRSLNDDDNKRISAAWAAYFANGVAPSPSLQPAFNMISNRADAEQLKQHKPPAEILEIFDRMLATDAEIKASNDKEISNAKVLHAEPSVHPTLTIYEKLNRIGRFGRAYIVGCGVWALYVLIRTETYFEFLGFEFSMWDRDSFVVNLVLPPIALIAGYKALHWIQSGKS